MALYVKSKANVFEVATKTSESGKEYAVCNIVFYSKSKDAKGNYTKDDPRLQVRAVAFGKNAKYLSSLVGGKGFVEITGKLYQEKYEKNGEAKYSLKFDIITVDDAQPNGESDMQEDDIED